MRGESDYAARFAACRRDVQQLSALASELEVVREPWARSLLIRVVMARRVLLATADKTPQHWLASYGLPEPDGRPLYRYRVSEQAFDRLHRDLIARAGAVSQNLYTTKDAARFVLWTAEWFRRCYSGGVQQWADVGRELGLSLQQATWRRLADEGLAYWRIPKLQLNGVHYRLAAVARQGGFPIAALKGGWAKQYLEALVSGLLAEPSSTLDMAERLAGELSDKAPQLWRTDEMRLVCAELAFAIVELRREAAAGGVLAGALVSGWLNGHRPDWREALPLAIDAEGGQALIDGLLSAQPLTRVAGAIGVRRRLLLTGEGEAREQLELKLDGVLDGADGQSLSAAAAEWSRLRLYAAGDLARHVAGELAVVEADEDGRWVCRSLSGSHRLDVPFGAAAAVELRGGGARVAGPFVLPGGDRVGEGLRVYSSDAEPDGQGVPPLVLVGTGSGGYRAETLYLDAPKLWEVRGRDESAQVVRLSAGDDGRRRWRISGAVLVWSERGDCYLVRSGQSGDQRDRLKLIGKPPSGCRPADDQDALFIDAPTIQLQEGGARLPDQRAGGPALRSRHGPGRRIVVDAEREHRLHERQPSRGLGPERGRCGQRRRQRRIARPGPNA